MGITPTIARARRRAKYPRMAPTSAPKPSHHLRHRASERSACGDIERAKRSAGVDLRIETHLIGEQIAETRNHRLVKQHRFHRSRPVANGVQRTTKLCQRRCEIDAEPTEVGLEYVSRPTSWIVHPEYPITESHDEPIPSMIVAATPVLEFGDRRHAVDHHTSGHSEMDTKHTTGGREQNVLTKAMHLGESTTHK